LKIMFSLNISKIAVLLFLEPVKTLYQTAEFKHRMQSTKHTYIYTFCWINLKWFVFEIKLITRVMVLILVSILKSSIVLMSHADETR
jgi:hypothetical protein